MLRFRLIFLVFPLFIINCKADHIQLRAEKYYISDEGDALSEKWGEYLFNHLSKRTRSGEKIVFQASIEGEEGKFKQIHFALEADMDYPYCIDHSLKRLEIRVRDEQTAVWMLYQLIEKLGQEDSRFEVSDLPPASLDFTGGCENFDFSYREAHLSANIDPDFSALIGSNNIDRDWGIWGHNLGNAVSKKDRTIFAKAEEGRKEEQYCFSSEELFLQVKNYIIDDYGDGRAENYRFMIAPNDNDIVCICELCQEKGNTKKNATPALIHFLNRLGEEFPAHAFYTLAYRTSYESPDIDLRENCGVFFSTINLPKGKEINENAGFLAFKKELKNWRQKTENIYIWDYISNFDDYLTPLPILHGLKEQLKTFKNLGIKGVFLNGSGYDYSPFDDVKTYVATQLMQNLSSTHVDTSIKKFFKKYYPITHEHLAQYYLQLEKDMERRRHGFGLYASFPESVRSYLDKERFLRFYDTLDVLSKEADDLEKRRLNKLLTALSFTRLQILYFYPEQEGLSSFERMEKERELLEALAQYPVFDNLQNYKETGGALSYYIEEWSKTRLYSKKNTIQEMEVRLEGDLQETEEQKVLSLLTDGRLGFPRDYQQGWFMGNEKETKLLLTSDFLKKIGKIQIRFLNLEKHGILLPTRVEIFEGEKQIGNIVPKLNKETESFGEILLPVTLQEKELYLKIYKPQEAKSIALDEITLLKQ